MPLVLFRKTNLFYLRRLVYYQHKSFLMEPEPLNSLLKMVQKRHTSENSQSVYFARGNTHHGFAHYLPESGVKKLLMQKVASNVYSQGIGHLIVVPSLVDAVVKITTLIFVKTVITGIQIKFPYLKRLGAFRLGLCHRLEP